MGGFLDENLWELEASLGSDFEMGKDFAGENCFEEEIVDLETFAGSGKNGLDELVEAFAALVDIIASFGDNRWSTYFPDMLDSGNLFFNLCLLDEGVAYFFSLLSFIFH